MILIKFYLMIYESLLLHEAIRLLLISIRLERRHTQRSLSLESGISRQFISQLECGKRIPSIDTLFVLTHALRINITAFMAELDLVYQRLFWQRHPVQDASILQNPITHVAESELPCLEYIRKAGGLPRP